MTAAHRARRARLTSDVVAFEIRLGSAAHAVDLAAPYQIDWPGSAEQKVPRRQPLRDAARRECVGQQECDFREFAQALIENRSDGPRRRPVADTSIRRAGSLGDRLLREVRRASTRGRCHWPPPRASGRRTGCEVVLNVLEPRVVSLCVAAIVSACLLASSCSYKKKKKTTKKLQKKNYYPRSSQPEVASARFLPERRMRSSCNSNQTEWYESTRGEAT